MLRFFCLLISFISIISFISPAQENLIPNDPFGRPIYEKNKILLKLTENAFAELTENSSIYTIPELRVLFSKYPVNDIKHLNPLSKISPKTEKRKSLARYFQVQFENQINVKELVGLFNELNSIELAEPSYINYYSEEPDDPYYDDQGFLEQINCPGAWDIHKGQDGISEVVVGICDSGTEWHHSDLIDNLYQNLGEDADGDGSVIEYIDDEWQFDTGDINYIDDDGNGKVDDFVGWNFWYIDGTPPNDPNSSPQNSHGTHVAGLAAGVTNNNSGISCVSWNVKFLPTKHGSNSGGASIYHGYTGIVYLVDMGVDIINCSWGSYHYTQYGKECVEYAIEQDIVVFVAAGNENENEIFHYPSAFPGIINVASVESDDSKSYYSDYGIAIDICSPGSAIYSTIPSNDYGYKSGTSMASPIAAGAFALLKSYRDDWSNEDLLQQFIGSADDISDQNTDIANQLGYGRINVHQALASDDADVTDDLKIYLEYPFEDENMDMIFQRGEIINIKPHIRNFNQFNGSDEVTYNVSCEQDFVEVYNGTGSFSVGPDQTKEVDAGHFIIDEDAEDTDLFTIDISFSCNEGISIGGTYTYQLKVNNGGEKIAFGYLLRDPNESGFMRAPYAFQLTDPDDLELLNYEFIDDWPSSGTWFDGKWLVSEFGSKRLFNINTVTGKRLDFVETKNHLHGMAVDPQTGLLYGVQGSTLYLIDPYSGYFHEIGSSGVKNFLNLACSPDGVLYTVDGRDDVFGSINSSNGEFTELFSIDHDLNDYQGMEYDIDNDVLYIAAYPRSDDSFLGIVDIENETVNVVGTFSSSVEIAAMAIPYEEIGLTQKMPYHRSKLQKTKTRFTWSDFERADSYDLIVSENNDLSDPVVDENTSDNEYIINGDLDHGTKYYWKVIAKNAGITIDETMIWEFTTIYECCEEPVDKDGDGYREISTLCHLRWLAENSFHWGEKYELVNNIDASDTEDWYIGDHDNDPMTDDEPMGWLPIGIYDVSQKDLAFTGEFNGNGYKISNLNVNRPGYDNVGFFGCISSGGKVYDLNINNADISGNDNVGVLSGIVFSHNTDLKTSIIINNCNTSGTISGHNRVGGFAGYNYAVDGNIEYKECNSNADFINNTGNEFNSIGGFSGHSYSEGYIQFNFCSSSGEIYINTTGEVNKVGGFAGSINNVFVTGCSSNANVEIENTYYDFEVGGFAGFAQNSEIENSFARGNALGASRIGGFCGYNYNSFLHNCYSTGTVQGSNRGGFCGMNNSVITGCYWDIETSGMSTSAGGIGRTTSQMMAQENYENWDFVDFWSIETDNNDGYPFIADIISKPLEEYYFSMDNGEYDQISDMGTVHASGSSTNQIYENIDIGFDFKYCGQDFDEVNISTYGYIQFGLFPELYHLGPLNKGMRYVISGLGRDLRCYDGDSEIRSYSSGDSPDRVFTVQYKNMVDGYSPYYSFDSDLNFQIKLYEADNSIEFVYGDIEFEQNSARYNVGFSGYDINDFYNRRVDQEENNWDNSYKGNKMNEGCDISDINKPSSGLSYKWTPVNTIDLESPMLSFPGNKSTNISVDVKFEWKEVFGGVNYIIQLSGSADFDEMIINEEVNDIYFAASGLSKSSKYFWRVKAKNSYMESQWSEIWNLTTENYECPWAFIDETGNSAEIIAPMDIEPRIFNRDFVDGDAIGAFYSNDDNDLICAGYGIWDGNDLERTVWGDDEQTTEKDGYSIGEEYILLAWDALKGRELESEFTIATGPDNYQIDAVTTLAGFQGGILDLQTIDLIEGWNMISAFLTPENSDIEQICNDIEEDMLLIKNVEGDMYFPSLAVNTLGSWDFDEGYKIYMMDDIQFDIYGGKISPENTPIELQTGWRIIPYLRDSEMSVVTCLNDIDGSYLIIKDIDGNMYFPALNINTLGNLMPGKGYMIYITEECNLTYPSNDFPKHVMIEEELSPKASFIQPAIKNTGNNMTLILQTDERYNAYEVGVLNQDGQIIGSGKVSERVAAITVWGDNDMTLKKDGAAPGENLTVFLSENGDHRIDLDITSVKSMIFNKTPNDLKYRTDDIIMAKASLDDNSFVDKTMLSCKPNPSNGETLVRFVLERRSDVSLELSSLNGQLLEVLSQGNMKAGEHNIRLNGEKYSSGHYIIRLITDNDIEEEILIITK